MLNSEAKNFISQSIRSIVDFPKPGIEFRDITTLLNNPKAYTLLMQHLAEKYADANFDAIAGIESRGFIFGASLANMLGVAFVPIRKPNKLPAKTIKESYQLEYGTDELEIHADAFADLGTKGEAKVLLIDDLIATGGSAIAAFNLIQKAGAKCAQTCFIIELKDLGGSEKLSKLVSTYSVLEF